DPRAADLAAESPGEVDRAGTSHVMRKVRLEGSVERRVRARLVVGRGQLAQGLDQGFGHESPAMAAEMAVRVWPGVEIGDVRAAHRIAGLRRDPALGRPV